MVLLQISKSQQHDVAFLIEISADQGYISINFYGVQSKSCQDKTEVLFRNLQLCIEPFTVGYFF